MCVELYVALLKFWSNLRIDKARLWVPIYKVSLRRRVRLGWDTADGNYQSKDTFNSGIRTF
jgi:hypothetical protein